jgi:hypothetical protein
MDCPLSERRLDGVIRCSANIGLLARRDFTISACFLPLFSPQPWAMQAEGDTSRFFDATIWARGEHENQAPVLGVAAIHNS